MIEPATTGGVLSILTGWVGDVALGRGDRRGAFRRPWGRERVGPRGAGAGGCARRGRRTSESDGDLCPVAGRVPTHAADGRDGLVGGVREGPDRPVHARDRG